MKSDTKLKRSALFIILLSIPFSAAFAQERPVNQGGNYTWEGGALPARYAQTPAIEASRAGYFEIDFSDLSLRDAAFEDQTIVLPDPDGGAVVYNLYRNTTMSDGLADQFPQISTGNIVRADDPNEWGKIDFTPKGMHAMIFRPGRQTLFIDPVGPENPNLHLIYRRRDFLTDKVQDCVLQGQSESIGLSAGGAGLPYNSCELRTYRLAVSATGEYTVFHGGTTEDALAGIVTTMNRVNGVYERDFSVTMSLIPNNADLIFENPDTDPFTNGSPGQMINENQQFTNNAVGAENYDIGHVFGTNSGGLAGLGVTCNDNAKARGVTGSAAPIGDPFDIDYVAHEIGHQFNSNHCFNNACGGNRNNSTAAEPGSGSTIMAYAGICIPNVQNNSDDHFHGISMREIGLRVQQDQCPVITPTSNTAPAIVSVAASAWVPGGTPFELDAEVTDAEDDMLTYNWEQMDTEISVQPPSPTSDGGPNFRSNAPAPVSSRMFPRLGVLVFGEDDTWERLSDVSREMNFRLSVRDNSPEGGCTQFSDVTVNVHDTGEPFTLEVPNAPGIVWQGLSYQEVVWNPAGTPEAPIEAETVDIFLSVSSVPAFDSLVAQNVPNSGSYFWQVANVNTTTARLMVRASNQPFFDLSAFNFIIQSTEEGFAFETSSQPAADGCTGDVFEFDLSANALGDLPGPIALDAVNLPDGFSVDFSTPAVSPGENFTVTVTTALNAASGLNAVQITGSSGAFFNDILLFTELVNAAPLSAPPLNPENGNENVAIHPTLSWEDNAVLAETYTVQLALDEDFSTLVFSASGLSANEVVTDELLPETEYFWRVLTISDCGESDFSETFSFTTVSCIGKTVTEVPVSGTLTASTAQVVTEGSVSEVSITNISGTHDSADQLLFSLESPSGTSVYLGGAGCGAEVTMRGSGSVAVDVPGEPQVNYPASTPAGYGPDIGPEHLIGPAVLAYDGNGLLGAELCDEPENAVLLDGKIAVVSRGTCPFTQKVLNVQSAGAVGVIVINNSGDNFIVPGGASNEVTIPSMMIGLSQGTELLELISAAAADFSVSYSDFAVAVNDIPCGSSGGLVQPVDPLSLFTGESAEGAWVLTAANPAASGSGSIADWSLQVCIEDAEGTVSVSSVEGAELSVFPNPARESVNVAWSGIGNFERVAVSDMHGRSVFIKNVRQTDRIEMNFSGLAPGVYVIRMEGPAMTDVRKVVISR